MESPVVDDDICILKHETVYGLTQESPVSVCAGHESVASHFALVTAYEDIKKRLRDTEKENSLLRRRVKQLEDKHFRSEAPPSEGPQYMNKAFSAYRGIYIEKEDLQMELNKVRFEKAEMERCFTEQLQAKELELLQLRSEMETNQVMKSLSDTSEYWQVERHNSDVNIHSLLEELEKNTLHNLCSSAQGVSENCVLHDDQSHDVTYSRALAIVQSYRDVLSEASRLHAVVQSQSDLMKNLQERERHCQDSDKCLDDVQKNTELSRGSVSQPPSAPLPSASGTHVLDGLQENCFKEAWPISRPAPLGSPSRCLPQSQRMSSLDDSSWSFPSTPRPSDAQFWDNSKSKSSTADCTKPY